MFSEKKSKIFAGDVTVGTQKVKIIGADKVSVRLYYDVFSNGICQYEEKYAMLDKNICHFIIEFLFVALVETKYHKHI